MSLVITGAVIAFACFGFGYFMGFCVIRACGKFMEENDGNIK